MKFRPPGRLLLRIVLALALCQQSGLLSGQTVVLSDAASDAAKRLEWLKSREASNVVSQPAPAVAGKHFAVSRGPGLRPVEPSTGDPNAKNEPVVLTNSSAPPAPARTAEARPAEPRPAATPAVKSPIAKSPSTPARVVETHPVTPAPKIARTVAETPKPDARTIAARSTPPALVERSTPTGRRTENPATNMRIADLSTPAPRATATPSIARSTPAVRPVASPTPDLRITQIHSVPHPAATPAPEMRPSATTRGGLASNRYPWKTSIVTTVFWVGEPVGGNNFTPNYSSSWDANWSQTYGGYDNPNPEARRNFIPVKFTPRQNPFYIALPYNDVTRGTTKPEARIVIPWFKETFAKEGQSVCRDRWVAVRNRAGRVAYAQWSDCGPFRTDHWQYVFGMERPKPNLNQGAGLDVSPAMRDYLGLQSTDVTDWKFVDARDVPPGPWSLYGENNTFAQRRSSRASAAANTIALTREPAF